MNDKYAYYKKRLEKKGIPAQQRELAIELYNLGDKDYAPDFLIRQMNQYKDPMVHETAKRETCMATALTLGRLYKSKWALILPKYDG